MPADQLATTAFADQTSLGWDAFFRGQLSTSWRKAILYSSPVRDNDTTETHLRWLLKKLHKYSLDVWEFRNGVLHGATNKERRHLQADLLREKVEAAYDQFAAGKILLFARDHYIFTKKTIENRLAGDDDTLLGWLRLLEVAMLAYARQHTAEQLQAARFFAPFRILGRQKLSRGHLETSAPSGPTDLVLPSNICNHRQREEDQLQQEVSLSTQSQYLASATKAEPLLGLSSTVLSDLFDAEHTTEPLEDSSCSIISPGPFHLAPLIDQHLSSDSSYTRSRQRDIALYYDTSTSSFLSTGTPIGYRTAARKEAIERADHLLQYMDTMLASSASSTITPPSGGSSASDRSSNNSTTSSASESIEPLWSSATQRLLRFPLERIADAPIASTPGINQDSAYLSWANSVTTDLGSCIPADSCASPSSSDDTVPFTPRPSTKQIYIEEFTPEEAQASPLEPRDIIYFPLAQSSGSLSSSPTASSLLAYQWYTDLDQSTFSAPASPPFMDSIYHSDTCSSSSRQVLEILSTPDSCPDSDDSAPMMRSLSGHLPFYPSSIEADSETVPSLDPGSGSDIISMPPSVEEIIELNSTDSNGSQEPPWLVTAHRATAFTFWGPPGCRSFPSSIPPCFGDR